MKINKQQILEYLYIFLVFLLFISIVIFLQMVQTITVYLNGIYYQSYLCYISNSTWIVRVVTIGITTLFYDFVLEKLRKGCKTIKKGPLKIKTCLSILLAVYILIMFFSSNQYLIGFITTNLYTIHLCQLHKIIYNKLHWIFKGVLNYFFIILTLPSSYLCLIDPNDDNGIKLLIGVLFAYIGALCIILFLQFKTNILSSINLIEEEQEDLSKLPLIQKNEIDPKIQKHNQFKITITMYTLLFFFLSIYLNTNAPAIQYAYIVDYKSSFYEQAIIHFLTFLIFYLVIKVITLEDSTNCLIVINCILLCLNIIVVNQTQQFIAAHLNFSIAAGATSQLLPQMISHLYKQFFDLFSEDYYVRLGLGFHFISFFLQNYQFKRIWDFPLYVFNGNLIPNDYGSNNYYEFYFPLIQISLNAFSIPFFYTALWFYNSEMRKFKDMLKKGDSQSSII